jgi:type III secretory pathway component EscT
LIVSGLGEILLGFAMSIPFSIVIASIGSTGRIVDLLRGNQIAEQLVPGFEERASALEKLLSLALFAGLFSSGLWKIPLNVFYKSFSIPPGAVFDNFVHPERIIEFTQLCLRECLWFIAPAVALLFACDMISLGLTRAAPKLNIQAELTGAKLILGLLFLSLLDWGIELGPKLLAGVLNLFGA